MKLRQVAVIGAGGQGRTLAFRAAAAGYRTVLEDVLPSKLRRARAVADGLSAAPELSFAGSVEEAAREADLVIDSVPDELESKLEIFSMLDRMAPPRTILLTPTRSLSIADLASCTYRADRCVAFDGLELGAPTGSELSILHTRETAPEVLVAVLDFWRRLGCYPRPMLDGAETLDLSLR